MEPPTEPQHCSLPLSAHFDGTKICTIPSLTEIEVKCSSFSTSRSNSTILSTSISENQNFTTDLDLVYTLDVEPLPPKQHNRVLRNVRNTFFTMYRRLFTVVFMSNIVGVGVMIGRYRRKLDDVGLLADLANIASANVMVALLVRVDYIVNAFFKICWSMPVSAPLRLRRALCKVYEYGGIHSGAAVCSLIWFTLFTALFTRDYILHPPKTTRNPSILTTTYILLAILLGLVTTAYPRFRMMSHDIFENFHRWGGWFALALFWVELLLFDHGQHPSSLGYTLLKFPAFWFQLISTIHAILPWFRLHKLHVIPEKHSDHAIRLHFKENIALFVGLRISHSPLREWHSFACIPVREGTGGSLLISNAGDWTRDTIDNSRPYYWIKGIPVTGVLPMARLFKKVIVVTTGSGIGPCLGVIQDVPLMGTKIRVVWSTPSPIETYGWDICQAVRNVDGQAVIIDTRLMKKEGRGRPDLTRIAWELYKSEEAEAVFVISNPMVTRKVVYGLESRGVPAFGPIWDS